MTVPKAAASGWSRSRPTHAGHWLWREDGYREPVELLLTARGTEVASVDDAPEGTPQFYWEQTSTDEHHMPGLWRVKPIA